MAARSKAGESGRRRTMTRCAPLVLLSLAGLVLVPAIATPDAGDLDTSMSEIRGLIERYTVDRGSLNRSLTVDSTPSRQDRMKRFYGEWVSSLKRLDFDRMGQGEKVDYLLFKSHLDYELRQLELQTKSLAETATLVPFAP